jgi:Trypsin
MTRRPTVTPLSRAQAPARHRAPTLLTSSWLMLCAACMTTPSDTPVVASVSVSSQALIGGFAADDASLDAVGAIVVTYADPFGGSFTDVSCSGTLIDEDTVLTAKHCLDSVRYFPGTGSEILFAIGSEALASTRTSAVIEVEAAPGEPYGGFSGYGHDVGILHLETAFDGVPTADVAQLDDDALGERYATLGFGQRSISSGAGTRLIGGVTVEANSGLTYELLIGDFETFHQWYTGMPLPPECADVPAIPPNGGFFPGPVVGPDGSYIDCTNTAFARGVYEQTRLEDANEVLAGRGEEDAHPCYGDSGGPLALVGDSGKLVVYGVVSGSVSSPQGSCGPGAIYAAFDEETLAFIEAAKAWEDPCEVTSPQGACEGSVARRCTTLQEGSRRNVSFDCDSVELACQPQADGGVGCGEDDSSFGPPEPVTGPDVVISSPRALLAPAFPSAAQSAQP